VYVKTLAGQTWTIVIEKGVATTIRDIMQSIEDQHGIPVESQRLIFAGRQLPPETTWSDSNMEYQTTLHCVLR
jgi:hypothetical protein